MTGAVHPVPPPSSLSRRLRVTQLVLSSAFAGTEGHVALLSRQLAALGVRVRVVCGDGNRRLIEEMEMAGIPVAPLRLGRHTLPSDWPEAHRVVAGWGAQIVHAHLGNSLLCGALLSAKEWPALVFTQHFLTPAYLMAAGPRRGARTLAHRLIHRRVAVAIGATDLVRTAMIEQEGFRADRVAVVPLGIDIAGVQHQARAGGASVRDELGLPRDAILLVTAARLEWEKGHETLLASLPRVLARHAGTYLLLAGDGSLAAALREQARRLGIEARVCFLGHRADVPRLLSQANLGVLPSHVDSFGLVLLEAMAVGTPVVACAAGGPREIVVDGATGLLVPPREPQALAAAIVTLLDDPRRARDMGLAGQRRVGEQFGARRMAEQILSVYAQVLRPPGL